MSQRSSNEPPSLGIYTGLMLVAFLSLVLGCVILVLQLSQYSWTAAN